MEEKYKSNSNYETLKKQGEKNYKNSKKRNKSNQRLNPQIMMI